jgi:hypothetical protein
MIKPFPMSVLDLTVPDDVDKQLWCLEEIEGTSSYGIYQKALRQMEQVLEDNMDDDGHFPGVHWDGFAYPEEAAKRLTLLALEHAMEWASDEDENGKVIYEWDEVATMMKDTIETWEGQIESFFQGGQ